MIRHVLRRSFGQILNKGKRLVLEDKKTYYSGTIIDTINTISGAYFFSKLFWSTPSMSFVSISFHSISFAIIGILGVFFSNLNRMSVTRIELLENKREIQLKTSGFLGIKFKYKLEIENFVTPEITAGYIRYVKEINSLVLFNGDHTFLINSKANIYDKEAVQSIIKGKTLETEEDDFIDI